MNNGQKVYEAPRMSIFRFAPNDPISTLSGNPEGDENTVKADYSARALNAAMDGTNTTIER